MDKRFFSFILITILIWGTWVSLRLAFNPPKPKAPANADEVDPQDPEKVVEKPDPDKPDPEKPEEPAKPDPEKPVDPDKPAEPEKPVEPAKPAAPLKRLTLGSLDPNGNYRMLVTLTSRGAAIERVELSDPKYTDIEDLHGYIGSLDLRTTAEGCRVGLVGPGTPADVAGLKADDILLAVDDEPLENPSDLERILRKFQPGKGKSLSLTVNRETNGAISKLSLSVTPTRQPVQMVQPETRSFGGVIETAPPSLRMSLATLGDENLKRDEDEFPGLPSLLDGTWEVADSGQDFVEFKITLPKAAVEKFGVEDGVEILKRYELQPVSDPASPSQGYHVTLKFIVRNPSQAPFKAAYRLLGLNGLPVEGWWYFGKLHPEMNYGAGARDIVYSATKGRHILYGGPRVQSEVRTALNENRDTRISLLKDNNAAPVEYIGVDTQFFAGVVLPAHEGDTPEMFRRVDADATDDVRRLPKRREKLVNSTFELTSVPHNVPAEGEWTQEFTVFLGPKDPNVLTPYGLNDLIEYGWAYAAYPAHLLQLLLNAIYAVVGNYGIAIILLTVIVRTCMLPFSIKQAKSAAKMQELAPEMAKLREKYKDDMEKQGKAMQELYAKHNFNPFGGCLLVFFQLPVFVGLYRCLSVDINLRNAPLIPGITWASNLAGPDRLFYWKDALWPMLGDEADGWLGPYFNVLPIITMVLFIIQQKLFTPPATDEQTEMQQKMMTYMTVFMGVLFYKVPAGLCLYIITSSLWGIAERKLLPKSTPPGTTAPAKVESKLPPPKPSNGKKAKRK